MPVLIQLRTQAQGCNCVLTLVKVVSLFISSYVIYYHAQKCGLKCHYHRRGAV